MRLQHLALVLGSLVTAVGSAWAQSQSQSQPANVIFVHPDGAALNSWNAARTYWKGPDGRLAWDLMPEMLVYRGHMSDRLGATSNGGATAHAFGQRVKGGGSFGRDGSREESVEITAASEIMATLCLSESRADLRERLERRNSEVSDADEDVEQEPRSDGECHERPGEADGGGSAVQ